MPAAKNRNMRPRAKSGPTDETLRQWGHLARALFNVLNMKASEQWTQITRDMPGVKLVGGVMGEGARLMMRLQFTRGHAMRIDELLQMRRQLHGQRTYFFPAGAFLTGVASLQCTHFTTC